MADDGEPAVPVTPSTPDATPAPFASYPPPSLSAAVPPPPPPPPYGWISAAAVPATAPYAFAPDLPPPIRSPRPWTYARFLNGQQVAPPWKGAPLQAIDAGLDGKALRVPSWGIPDSVVSQVLTLILTFGFGFAFYAVTSETPLRNVIAIFASLTLQWIIMGGWPLFVSYWRGNGPRLDYGFSFGLRDIGPGLLGAVSLLFGAGLAVAITRLIFGAFTSNAGQVVDDLSRYKVAELAFMVLGVIGAPVIEELAFRGLMWSSLAKRGLNGWWSTAITAVAFAALHFEWVRFGVLLVAGLVLGFLRQFTGRLGPSMIAHICLNAIAFIGAGMILF